MQEGNYVYWNDPEGIASGEYIIEFINEDIITISDGFSTAEVFKEELELIEK